MLLQYLLVSNETISSYSCTSPDELKEIPGNFKSQPIKYYKLPNRMAENVWCKALISCSDSLTESLNNIKVPFKNIKGNILIAIDSIGNNSKVIFTDSLNVNELGYTPSHDLFDALKWKKEYWKSELIAKFETDTEGNIKDFQFVRKRIFATNEYDKNFTGIVDSSKLPGERTAESILQVIRDNIPKFQDVYIKYLKENKNLAKAKIVFKFTINPAGKIVAISTVSSNTNCKNLDRAIYERLRRLEFAPIKYGNVTATYGFNFEE